MSNKETFENLEDLVVIDDDQQEQGLQHGIEGLDQIVIDKDELDSMDDDPIDEDVLEEDEVDDLQEDTEIESEKNVPGSIKKLLSQRNEARREIAEKDKKIQELEDANDGDFNEDEYLSNLLEEENLLIEKYPNAKEYIDEIRDVALSNPGVSPEFIYKMVMFDHMSDEAHINRQSMGKYDLVGDTPNSLRKSKDFDELNTDAQFDYLKTQYKKGKLRI